MTYTDYETALSAARLNRYKIAVGGDLAKAIRLYRLNVLLSQRFYALLSVFEVCLRNYIDIYYTAHFEDAEWLKNNVSARVFSTMPLLKQAVSSPEKMLIRLSEAWGLDIRMIV